MKRKITIIVLAICIVIGVFSFMKFDVVVRINNAIAEMQNKWAPDEDLEFAGDRYIVLDTIIDKDGNEVVVEKLYTVFPDPETGELVLDCDILPKDIYRNDYEGKIVKIEGSKIYFYVYREISSDTDNLYKDVKDYQRIFDFNDYKEKSDWIGFKSVGLDSTEELERYIGFNMRAEDIMFEDNYSKKRYKVLNFYLQ